MDGEDGEEEDVFNCGEEEADGGVEEVYEWEDGGADRGVVIKGVAGVVAIVGTKN